jgi:hypothetical protein
VAWFGPARPDAGEADTDPGVPDGSELAAAPTAEAVAPVPLADDGQAFVSDGAAAPATGVPNGNGTQPGSGMLPSNGVPHQNGAVPPNGTGHGSGTGPGNGAAPAVIVPPATSSGDENRLPIFESVESDWFRRGRLGSDGHVPVSSQVPSPASWSSPADEGWQAAGVAQAPVSSGTTPAGLPKRVPMANLVPGSAGASPAPAEPAAPRSAAQARERMASFQQGIRNARSATPTGEDYPGAEDGREEDQ